MTRSQRIGVIGLCVVLAAGSLVPAFLQGAVPSKLSTVPSPPRTLEAIVKDLSAADEKLQGIVPTPAAFADPAFRSGDGLKAIPVLKQMVGYFEELEKIAPSADTKDNVRTNRYRFLGFIATLGDKPTLDALEKAAKGGGPEALSAKSALTMSKWLSLSKDADGQTKLLEEYGAVAKANPKSDEVGETLGLMANLGGANEDVNKRVIATIRENLSSDQSKALLASLDRQQAQQQEAGEAEKKQRELLGKSLALEGRTSTGGKFALADYKGKVVLVDFWATWCGPCIAELPHVKDTYKEYHGKGLEIVGVSCDSGDSVLNDFIAKNEMSWIQLREESQGAGADQWHPLAKQYGVMGIPTMFLVDRKGVVRYVDAREDLTKKVAELVAEGDGPTTKPAQK